MAAVLTDIASPRVVDAIAENVAELWRRTFGAWPRARLDDESDALRSVTGIPHEFFNAVHLARLDERHADARIAELLDDYRRRRVPGTWWVGPTSAPADLTRLLAEHGLRGGGDMPGMAADIRALPESTPVPVEFTVERVAGHGQLREMAVPLGAGFEFSDQTMPSLLELFSAGGYGEDAPLAHFLGRLDGRPVACSSLHLGAGVAGVYNVATVPEAQRLGIGTAMTLAPIAHARALGYRVTILHASRYGYPIYLRLGFQTRCAIGVWLYEPPPLGGEDVLVRTEDAA